MLIIPLSPSLLNSGTVGTTVPGPGSSAAILMNI